MDTALISCCLFTACAFPTDIESVYNYPGGGLGTFAYPATPREAQAMHGVANAKGKDAYDTIMTAAGTKVAWFGIIRSLQTADGLTTLLIEHKKFDGMTDLHQQIVSINGSGDFTATCRNASGIAFKKWRLVRVIGRVDDQRVIADPDYLRYWDWPHFAFMAYGEDTGNPAWKALRKATELEAYTSTPTPGYYLATLGFNR